MEPPQTAGPSSGPRVNGAKRLKIDVACENCRAKKVKCDGVRPTCGSCARKLSLRDNCKYSNGAFIRREMDGPHPNLSHEKSHESSLPPSMLNPPVPGVDIRRVSTSHVPPPPQMAMQSTAKQTPRPHVSPAGTTPGSRQGEDSQGHRQVGASVCSTSPSVIDSMTAVVDEGTSTGEFFGNSSAGSFTAQIKKAIDVRFGKSTNGSSRQNAPPSRSVMGMTGANNMHAPDIAYVLPPRRQADYLMELYWFYVDPLYPFLDRRRWTHAYNAIFNGTAIDFDERIFVATLNILFALSTQLHESQTLEQREHSSNEYFRRAQELLPMSPWESGSLELVQCLLVTSQYLQSTYNPHQTWMVVGSAVRMAQGLGLHLPETSADRTDPEERELLRRIWYGCVLMDRMVSVTHGRPAMISPNPEQVVPLPLTFPAATDAQDAATRQNSTHSSFFVESVRLYEIIHQIMDAFYAGSTGRHRSKESHASEHDSSESEDEDLDKVVQLDRSLSKWENRLPNHLKWSMLDVTTDEIARRQAVILRMRFLHARILLLRPLLSRFCLSQAPTDKGLVDDTLQARVVQQGALFCVSTAQSIIATLLKHQSPDSTVGLLPAWWYRVYYVYSAATVLIAAKLRPEVFPAAEIGRTWCQAISVLKAHEKFGQSARRCVAALHILSSKILQAVPASGSGDADGRRHLARIDDGAHHGQLNDAPADAEFPDLVQQLADEFAPPISDLDQQDLAAFNFDVNDMSWLNDMQGVWELLNE